MRASFQSSAFGIRWPRVKVTVDDEGIVAELPRKRPDWKADWDEVEKLVQCGFYVRSNVRVVPEDGPRFVVGAPGLVKLVREHAPDGLLRTERRRWFPWLRHVPGEGIAINRPGQPRR